MAGTQALTKQLTPALCTYLTWFNHTTMYTQEQAFLCPNLHFVFHLFL